MNRRKLAKLEKLMKAMRRAPKNARAFESLAKQLGRKSVRRGREPMWESAEFDGLYVLSIPHHGGKDLSVGVRNSILNQLEDDVHAWKVRLMEDEDGPDSEA